ncbi:MAG: Hpt domain-containing protein [Nitrospinota bacterium]|nr:Hpt domain-containing protein [Nitrospinota bacterium]
MDTKKEAILKEMGDIPEEFYYELVREFLSDAFGQIDSLESSLKGGDIESAKRTIHSIKGVSANLRLNDICQLSKEVEADIKNGLGFDEIAGKVDAMRSILVRLSDEVD